MTVELDEKIYSAEREAVKGLTGSVNYFARYCRQLALDPFSWSLVLPLWLARAAERCVPGVSRRFQLASVRFCGSRHLLAGTCNISSMFMVCY